jgi:hypothetical protein
LSEAFKIWHKSLRVLMVKVMSQFVKSIGAMLRSFSLPALPARGINEDPTCWLDGARPSRKF